MATRDANGALLDGGKNYRFHLPPTVPVKLFWSVVVYDALSRSELQNGEEFPSVSQYTGPVANADGSVDIYRTALNSTETVLPVVWVAPRPRHGHDNRD